MLNNKNESLFTFKCKKLSKFCRFCILLFNNKTRCCILVFHKLLMELLCSCQVVSGDKLSTPNETFGSSLDDVAVAVSIMVSTYQKESKKVCLLWVE